MGTRADFYIGRGLDAEWLGSIAMDGYPSCILPRDERKTESPFTQGLMRHLPQPWPVGAGLFDSTTETEFRERVARVLQYRNDATTPADGWPWPWDDSRTTDYAYAFDGGRVWASPFGYAWFDPREPEPEEGDDEPVKVAVFPDMSARRAVTFGPRSGLLVMRLAGAKED